MINNEYINNGTLIRHYSSSGMKILQKETGLVYNDAIDIVPCCYTYTETDVPIDPPERVDGYELNDAL